MKNGKMNIVTIAAGDYEAKINLSRGANCISLSNAKYDAQILRVPDYSRELDNPYLYGMPILFPVNRISGGRFEFEGRDYVFPINEEKTGCFIHGVLHESEFTAERMNENTVLCSFTAQNGNPYPGFPHNFKIEIEYSIAENKFNQITRVINLSDKNMPVFLGYHTTFAVPFLKDSNPDDLRVSVPIGAEFERNMENYLPTGNMPAPDKITSALNEGCFSPFSMPISKHYRKGASDKMMISDIKRRIRVVYENDEKLAYRLIYNGDADEYICLEPQNCIANCANSPFKRADAGFDYIKPQECKEYYSKIWIEKF